MRKLLLPAALALAMATPAAADAVNNLSFSVLGAGAVSQSNSNPCVICATQAQNPSGFGFNNFNSQGNDSTFNLFSSAITGQFGNDDQTNVTPYTDGFLRSFLQNLPIPDVTLTFGIAIDINTAKNGETLQTFQLIDLDKAPGSRVIFDINGPIAMPKQNNGNGFADYLITGFDLSGIDPNDRLLFRASWSGATDGGESFYIVPQLVAVPGPVAGAGIPGILAACAALWGLALRRKKRLSLVA